MNVAHLTGTVRYVHVKTFTDYVVVSLKVELPETEEVLWVQVSNVEKAHGDLDRIQKLDGKIVIIEGKLKSRYKKADPPKYPKERTFYDISTKPSGIKAVDQLIHGVGQNFVKISGQVKEVKTNNKNRVFFKMGIRYYNPKTKAFGEWFARVRCPGEYTEEHILKGQEVAVVGQLADDDGAIINATQVVHVQKLK